VGRAAALDAGSALEVLAETRAEQDDVGADSLQEDRDQPVLVGQQCMKQVLGGDLRVPMLDRGGLRGLQCLLGFDGKFLEIHGNQAFLRAIQLFIDMKNTI
jgi:hypothetical protein